MSRTAPTTRRIFITFSIHAFLLALTMSMIDLNTVFPALVDQLTRSKVLFGALYSILLGAPMVMNIYFGHLLSRFRYRKKFLILGIFLRAFSFLGMAWFTWRFADTHPEWTLASLFLWITVFSVSGGFAGIAYSDLIGTLVPGPRRSTLLAVKQLSFGLGALTGGILIARLLNPDTLAFPNSYAVSFSIGFIGLALASIGFFALREPPHRVPEERVPFSAYLKTVPTLLKSDRPFRRFILVENLSGFGLMVLPFYMIYAREVLHVDGSYIGIYLLFQIGGQLVSNLIWGQLARKATGRAVMRLCLVTGGLLPLLALGLGRLGADAFAALFFLIGFVISGRHIGFEAALLELAPDERRTDYLGIRGTLNLFSVFLPLLGGAFIAAAGYRLAFLSVSVILLATGVFLAGFRSPACPDADRTDPED